MYNVTYSIIYIEAAVVFVVFIFKNTLLYFICYYNFYLESFILFSEEEPRGKKQTLCALDPDPAYNSYSISSLWFLYTHTHTLFRSSPSVRVKFDSNKKRRGEEGEEEEKGTSGLSEIGMGRSREKNGEGKQGWEIGAGENKKVHDEVRVRTSFGRLLFIQRMEEGNKERGRK